MIALRHGRTFVILMVTAAFTMTAPASAANTSLTTNAPKGFESLSAERSVMLDIYVGGEKRGQTMARIQLGRLIFDHPQHVAGLIPDTIEPSGLVAALSVPLPTNDALVCGFQNSLTCGRLNPQFVGIILDEDNFKVDIFVHPRLLKSESLASPEFLEAPAGDFSAISLFGATVSGSVGRDQSYHLQNRTIASVGAARLRSDLSLASGHGLTIDNLTAEVDKDDLRLVGGILWAPGLELVGRRKIIGVGVTTQLDTRSDRESLIGTPLNVFLRGPARVDVLVDGRVMSSRIYPAGNRLLDTASLPEGSYEIILRIQEDGRPAIKEPRFFTKGSRIAPMGRPLYSAYVGMLSGTGTGSNLSNRDLFYQASAAVRLAPRLGIDGRLIGTSQKALVEGGSVLFTSLAQLRLAGLVSSSGDVGAVAQGHSLLKGDLSFSFDLRTVKSRGSRGLLPDTPSGGSFSDDPRRGIGDQGSFTQGLALIGYRLGEANLRLTGQYRRDGSRHTSYSLGASVDAPVMRMKRMTMFFQGDVRRTDRETTALVGMRFLANTGRVLLSGTAGLSYQGKGPEGGVRPVGELQAGWSGRVAESASASADAAVGREREITFTRASGQYLSNAFGVRADLIHHIDNRSTTQYSTTLESGLAFYGGSANVTGREMADSALRITIPAAAEGRFDVFVDEVHRGSVSSRDPLLLFLPPYKAYHVRLKPQASALAIFDTAPRKITLYPGNVASLQWQVSRFVIVFGRALAADGSPVRNADLTSARGIARTDGHGYFQIEAAQSDILRATRPSGGDCSIDLGEVAITGSYRSIGNVTCN